jgi:hypothetical protein
MNQEPVDPHLELRRLVALLDKTAKVAEHGSLTGSLSGGKAYAIRSYNSILEHVSSTGQAPKTLFPPLPENASLADVGIACAQLAEYLRAGMPEPPRRGKGAFMKAGGQDGEVVISLGELGDLGDLVRERLPEWLRGKRGPRPPEPPPPPSGGSTSTEEPRVARLWQPEGGSGLEELRTTEQQGAGGSVAPNVSQRRREILEALSAGSISPEEAAAQLEAL